MYFPMSTALSTFSIYSLVLFQKILWESFKKNLAQSRRTSAEKWCALEKSQFVKHNDSESFDLLEVLKLNLLGSEKFNHPSSFVDVSNSSISGFS